MIKNSFYNLFGGIIRLLLGVLSVPLLLQWLGTRSYGLYAIMLSIVNFALIAEGILPIILTVFLARSYSEIQEPTGKQIQTVNTLRATFWFIIGLGTITTLLLWGLAPLLPLFFDHISSNEQHTLLNSIRLSSLLIFTRLLQQYFIGIEQANGLFKLYNIINSAFGMAQTLTTLIVVYYSHSVIWAIGSQFIVALIFVIIHIYACLKQKLLPRFRIFASIDRALMREMLQYAFRTGIGLLGTLLFSQGDRVIVAKILGFEIAGIYSAVTSVVSQINSLSGLPMQPVVSEVSTALAQKQTDSFYLSNIVKKALGLNALIAVSLGCSTLLLTPELIGWLFGGTIKDVANVVTGTRLVTIIYTLYSLNAIGFYILFATQQEIYNSIFTMIGGSVVLVLILLLCPYIGLQGAFLGNVGYLLTLYLTHKGVSILKLPISLPYTILWRPLLIFATVIIISYSTQIMIIRWIGFILSNLLIIILFFDVFKLKLKNIKF